MLRIGILTLNVHLRIECLKRSESRRTFKCSVGGMNMTPMIELPITDISGPAEASPDGPEALSMRPGIFKGRASAFCILGWPLWFSMIVKIDRGRV